MIKDDEIYATHMMKIYMEEKEIVLPDEYFKKFNEYKEEYSLKPKSIKIPLPYSKLQEIEQRNIQNTEELSKQTIAAIQAIHDKSEKTLQTIAEETKKLREELSQMKVSLYIDELTKCHNRKWFIDNMLTENGDNFKESGVIAIIDLNNFKKINDNYGHNIGDQVLKLVGTMLQMTHLDVVRYGGDEFFVISTDEELTEKELECRLDEIQFDMMKKKFKIAKTKTELKYKISFAYGCSKFKKGDNYVSVIDKADEKMYKNKEKIKKMIKG